MAGSELLRLVAVIWLVNCLLAWAGAVRHAYRAYVAWEDRRVLNGRHQDGLLRYAVGGALLNEVVRTILKLGLCAIGILVLWRLLDRWEENLALLDWRDLAGALLLTAVLLVLTVGSDLELRRRPPVIQEAVPQ